jgi:50S ribosomal protein L16 3-hydroxylase
MNAQPPRSAPRRSVRLDAASTRATDLGRPMSFLGGLSPREFMAEYWQRKPLLVRQAIPGFAPSVGRDELFRMAAREEVESRCVLSEQGPDQPWTLRTGPFRRRDLPPLRQPGWSLLVQGVDIHHASVSDLKRRLSFIPAARLDDVMISYASDGGGVGPHFDSYDVFLLQAHGQRRWRIGPQRDLSLREGLPLKILAHFKPEVEYVLEPGDMLYLPPRYAHDGIASGECMTWSIGFRAPHRVELAQELMSRLADEAPDLVSDRIYQDAGQRPTQQSAQVPEALQYFAQEAVADLMKRPRLLHQALGEYLTEPKPQVWFDAPSQPTVLRRKMGICLDRRSQMLYDRSHIFLNGESWRASGEDARWMRVLADRREFSGAELKQVSGEVLALLQEWVDAGWAHPMGE